MERARLRFGVVLGLAACVLGCDASDEVASNDRPRSGSNISPELESLARALAGPDIRIARVLDHEGGRWALAVEKGDAALVAAKPPSGTDGVPASLLLVIDSSKKTASWPIALARVLDAALATGSDETVGYIDSEGKPCVVTGWAPTCSELHAEPVGMDVSKNGQLVFAASDGIGTHLFQLSADHAKPVRLSTGPAHHDRPLYDPDGTRVVFVGESGGLAALFVVDVQAGSVKQLTNVGKSLGPPGSDSRLPKDFVPPPSTRSEMSWDSQGIHYRAGGSGWHVDPASGKANPEVPR